MSRQRYQKTQETAQPLDWAELPTLDLSVLHKPGGLDELAEQARYAVRNVGFFYVKNFGISDETVDRQFELAASFFGLPLDEKLQYFNRDDYSSGKNVGYRPITWREPINGVKENTQIYSMPKFDGREPRRHPAVLEEHIAEIESFQRTCHERVLHPLLRIMERVLDTPGGTLVGMHRYDTQGEDQLRYMHYASRSQEDNQKLGNIYAAGHTDLGTLTLLFRQPIAGLQILNSNNEWKWVKPQPSTLTVNICDALSALSCGYLKSSIHRVHAPPLDQAHLDRIGVLYFGRVNNHVYLDPIPNSKLLQGLNLTENDLTKSGMRMTMGEWVQARGAQHSRRKKPTKVTSDGVYQWDQKDLAVVGQLSVQNYN